MSGSPEGSLGQLGWRCIAMHDEKKVIDGDSIASRVEAIASRLEASTSKG